MSKETLMQDLVTITRALGEGSPMHGLVEHMLGTETEIVAISVEVEVDHAVINYQAADGTFGQRRFDLDTVTDRFKLHRFNVFIFGSTVDKATSARRTSDGTITFHF